MFVHKPLRTDDIIATIDAVCSVFEEKWDRIYVRVYLTSIATHPSNASLAIRFHTSEGRIRLCLMMGRVRIRQAVKAGVLDMKSIRPIALGQYQPEPFHYRHAKSQAPFARIFSADRLTADLLGVNLAFSPDYKRKTRRFALLHSALRTIWIAPDSRS